MGKLYWRNGTYYAEFYDRNNERQRRSTRTADPVVAKQRLRDLELATTDRGSHQTEELSDALDYFTNVVCAGKSPGTVSCYEQKAAHVGRLIGGELVDKLRRETIERYIAERLKEGAHRHSVHKELVVLRGALGSAQKRDRFHGSMEIVPAFDSGYTPRTTYLTPEQFLALVPKLVPDAPPKASEKTRARLEQRMQRRAFFCVLIAYASPRRGEIEKLEWPHVDLDRGVIQIPKGKTKPRPIAIHPELRPWLEGFGELAGWTGPLVEPWTNIGRDLPAACVRAGVPRCTPNDLRRTFASWLIQAGVSNRIVAGLLGHTTTRMVDLIYGQLSDAALAEAVGRLPNLSCAAGVSNEVPRSGTTGTTGHTPSSPTITNSVEESFASDSYVVPRVGIEPTTRGFSGLSDLAPKVARCQPKLRAV